MAVAPLTTATLIKRHRHHWRLVVRSHFVIGVRDGSVPVATFDRWLVQDRLFVDALFPVLSRLAAAAPARDRGLLVQGLRDLQDNLEWFDRTLDRRGIDPNGPVHPVTRAYIDFCTSLAFERYPVALVAIWAQYRAYGDSWSFAHPGAPKFRKVVGNWHSPRYALFLRRFARATDAALAEASPAERAGAEDAFVRITNYEFAFWVMAMEETRRPA
jgi:thiaminase/transcriptional activator TenA